jgi:hypothetical protein
MTPILDDDGPTVPRSRGRRKADQENGWTVERKLLIATFVCSVVGVAFSAGFNWAKLVNVQDAVLKLQSVHDNLSEIYVPRELYETNQRHLTQAIEKLNTTLEKMQDSKDKDDDRLPIGIRRFDR